MSQRFLHSQTCGVLAAAGFLMILGISALVMCRATVPRGTTIRVPCRLVGGVPSETASKTSSWGIGTLDGDVEDEDKDTRMAGGRFFPFLAAGLDFL